MHSLKIHGQYKFIRRREFGYNMSDERENDDLQEHSPMMSAVSLNGDEMCDC